MAESTVRHLVVIGASAGGIEALSTLVATLPAPFPAPLVVFPHLDPGPTSHVVEMLARRSTVPVREVTGELWLENDMVFVVPSNRKVEITDHTLSLRRDDGESVSSFDSLLTSAARAFGENVFGVILNGMGSAGALGARIVKDAGGMVVMQKWPTVPLTDAAGKEAATLTDAAGKEAATFARMAGSIPPTLVDVATEIENIAPLLRDLLAGGYLPPQPAENPALRTLLEQIHAATGIDFSHYKASTIQRRLQRRMAATRSRDVSDYAHYVHSHLDEYERLVRAFLIKVTEFFRDDAFFAYLRTQIMPELLATARAHDHELRLWSAGCATGEEAYSLAILVAEALGEALDRFSVRIFATDLDAAAIAYARRGIYAPSALATVPPALRARYFTKVDDAYEVSRRVRSLVVFGEHDLAHRAPFPRIDLCLCRNVFIYFSPGLQERALQLFTFSVRDRGYLVLGKAESVPAMDEYFVPAHPQLRVYRRQGSRLVLPVGPLGGAAAPRPQSLDRPLTADSGRKGSGTIAGKKTAAAMTGGNLTRPRSLAVNPKAHPDSPIANRQMIPATPDLPIANSQMIPATRGPRPGSATALEAALLRDLAVGVVVVDQRYDIQIINLAAQRLLGIPEPSVGEDLLHLLDPVSLDRPIAGKKTAAAMPHLRAALDVVLAGGEARTLLVEVDAVQGPRILQLTCYAPDFVEAEAGPAEPRAVLLITEITTAAETWRAGEAAQAHDFASLKDSEGHLRDEVGRIETALQRARVANSDLETANARLSRINATLRSENAALEVNTEELQAALEEVETLNEELHATNEELETLNEELQATIEELNTTNADLEGRSLEVQALAVEREEQRKMSEAARARLAAILASMSDAVLVVDGTGAVVLANALDRPIAGKNTAVAMANQLFGATGQDIVAEDEKGKPLPRDAMPHTRAARGEVFRMTFTVPAAADGRRWFEATGGPIMSDDRARGVVVIRDITDRSLRRLTDEFLALASHELRTPLTSIVGYLQLLDRLLRTAPIDQRAKRYLQLVQGQFQSLNRLIDDLLDLGRLQEGKMTLTCGRVDLVALVESQVEAVRLSVARPPVHLEVAQRPLVVWGDPTRLRQVVLNLLSNATTHAASSPQITVRLWREAGAAVLAVRDEGPGIAASNLPRIFERLYQAGPPDGRTGLGIGLYITRELVRAHGDEISVESQEGVGSTFTVRLPLLEHDEPTAVNPQ